MFGNFGFDEKIFSKMKGFWKLVNLVKIVCEIVVLSCWNDPLFIVDEKPTTQLEKFVGVRSQQNLSENRAVGVCQTFLTTTGRPGGSTVNGHISDRWGKTVDRPVDPNKQKALTSARSTRAVGRRAHMHSRARRSTGSIDRRLSDLFKTESGKKEIFGLNFLV